MKITGLKIQNHGDETWTVTFTQDGVGQKHVRVSHAETRALVAFAFTGMDQPRERTAEERAEAERRNADWLPAARAKEAAARRGER